MTLEEMIPYHEAAHAVTAEHLRPGSLLRIVCRTPTLDEAILTGVSDESLAFVQVDLDWCMQDTNTYLQMVYAGKWAERRMGWDDPNTTSSDMDLASWVHPSRFVRAARSRQSRKLVDRLWDDIEKVALACPYGTSLERDEFLEVLSW